MTGCRSGAPLGARRGTCPEPVISQEDAETLGVSRQWCIAHARQLATVKATIPGRRSPKVTPSREGVRVRHVEPTKPRKTNKIDRDAMARKLSEHVAQATAYPVHKAAACEALGVSSAVVAGAAKIAVERGWVVSQYNAGPSSARGYYVGPQQP